MSVLPAIVSILGLINSRRQQQPQAYQMQGSQGGGQQQTPQQPQSNYGKIGGFLNKAGNVAGNINNIYGLLSALGDRNRQLVKPYQMRLTQRR